MKLTLGIDLGNGFTKYTGGKFASLVEQIDQIQVEGITPQDVHNVMFNGLTYTVGQGNQFISEKRFTEESYKICLLTAIALSSVNSKISGKIKKIEANIVLGLPVGEYNRLKDEMIQYLSDTLKDSETIIVDGEVYQISVTGIQVFIEGALPLIKNGLEQVVIYDIGAGTINVQGWDNKSLVNRDTFQTGFTHMCSELANKIKSKYGVTVEAGDMVRYIDKKVIKNNRVGTVIDLTELIDTHFDGIVQDLLSKTQTGFKLATADNILLIGGGAEILAKHFRSKYLNTEVVTENQFVNQKIYQIVSKELFK